MKPIQFVATCQSDASRYFYQSILGFDLIEDQPFALVFDTGGFQLRVQKVESVVSPPYTSAGWLVTDLNQEVTRLTGRGVTLQRYPHLDQDETGVWTTPDGTRIVWFCDPDGNLLSLTEAAPRPDQHPGSRA